MGVPLLVKVSAQMYIVEARRIVTIGEFYLLQQTTVSYTKLSVIVLIQYLQPSLVFHCLPITDGMPISYDESPDGSGNYPFGTVAMFSCMAEFGLVGAASSTCGGDGSSPTGMFAPANPTCEGEDTPTVDIHDSV